MYTRDGSPTKGSPTNNVSPTSTPAKSGGSVPTLEPPPPEAAGEPATDSLLDLDPLSSSGPSAGGASAAPTSWGDLLGSEFGSLTTETLLPDSSSAVDSASPATATASATTDMFGPPAAEPSTAAAESVAGDTAPSEDPFAPTDGQSPVSPELDLFSMQPVEDTASGFSPLVPPAVQSALDTSNTISAPPVPPSPTVASAAPTIDFFGDFLEPTPEPTVHKSEAPSLDAFLSDVFCPPPASLSAPLSRSDSGPAADPAVESAGVANNQAAATEAPVTSAAPAAPATTVPVPSAGGDLMGAFGGLGDMLLPAMSAPAASPVKPTGGGELDSTMASLAANLGMGSQKPGETAGGANWQPQVAAPSWGMPMLAPSGVSPFMGSQQPFGMPPAPGAAPMPGSPMTFPQQPMMRPQFPPAGGPGAPMSSGMAQSPRKPPPAKDPLADLNIKDFL
ncbi:uncharacterized protein snap91b [Brachyhypopomus gauderio]|uniref:uncharacterized protein snap91b n=1 Tax=Brachyhypopomus gauderio TaxID=698409 RepID=UPI004042E169